MMKNVYYYLRFAWVKSMHLGAHLGCHQLPERSFYFRNYQFPVCARCCGALIGEIAALTALFFKFKIPLYADFILMGTMFTDWFIQFIGILESNNIRRLITGILGGYGCWSLFFKTIFFIIGLFSS